MTLSWEEIIANYTQRKQQYLGEGLTEHDADLVARRMMKLDVDYALSSRLFLTQREMRERLMLLAKE